MAKTSDPLAGKDLILWAVWICENVCGCPPSDAMLLAVIRECSDVTRCRTPAPQPKNIADDAATLKEWALWCGVEIKE